MIGMLKGIIAWKDKNVVIIDINGVGYQVETTQQTKIPPSGEAIKLFIYTYVKEDDLKLFGFNSMEEKQLFETLLSVSGIGPRAGINILSTLTYDKFINAILTENIPVLKQISGIGSKTAQRLILELKSKLSELARSVPTGKVHDSRDDDLYDALESLGYSASEINEAITKTGLDNDSLLEDKIKIVLRYLGKVNI